MSLVQRLIVLLVVVTSCLNIYIFNYPFLHGCKWEPGAEIKILAFGDPQITGSGEHTPLRKRVDIVGNDMFLKHVSRTLQRWLRPTAVVVMGDLISSQWISSAEFALRGDRFEKIFPQGPVPVFNISGNHDVGYHGEMTAERVDRYKKRYGPVNFVEQWDLDGRPWRLVGINSLSLDGPPHDDIYTHETYAFLDVLAQTPYDGQTVLLTHVPLYKTAGICRDSEYFSYYPDGALREQNHLSGVATHRLLNSVFSGPGHGIILAGHDHEGCLASYNGHPEGYFVERGLSGQIPEVTVRSMMGQYGGNGGLVSGVWDTDAQRWVFHFSLCRFQVQHLWWITTIATYVTVGVVAAYVPWQQHGRRRRRVRYIN